LGDRPQPTPTDDALSRVEQRAQLAVEVARLGTWEWRREEGASVYHADARCREIAGIAPDEPVSRHVLLAHVHPDDRARVDHVLSAALDPTGPGVYEQPMRFLHGDGSVRWTVARGRAMFAGEGPSRLPTGLFGSLVDVTAQVQANDRYRALFDSIDRGFCIVEVLFDAGGKAVDYRFLETNPRFVEETGLVNAVGRRMRELAPEHEEHWFRLYGEVARTGRPLRFQHRAEALDRWYDVYAYRVGDPLAHQVGILFADVSEHKRFEQALLDADRRKDEFLATLAHELRNPLAPLRTALNVLAMPHDTAQDERLHAIMARQVDQLTRLVGDLMEVSRITRGEVLLRKTPLDLREVLEDAVETSRPALDAAEQSLVVDLPDDALPIEGDALRLEQVFTNLLNNAARYGCRGGRVDVRAWREGGAVFAAVRDDGIGIPADKLLAIFEPFTQLDRRSDSVQGGLGIGLSLVRNLVAHHGGEVAATSPGEGQGSEFVVRLPVSDRSAG
jgi:PAS domain S-box-containing protein